MNTYDSINSSDSNTILTRCLLLPITLHFKMRKLTQGQLDNLAKEWLA